MTDSMYENKPISQEDMFICMYIQLFFASEEKINKNPLFWLWFNIPNAEIGSPFWTSYLQVDTILSN